MKQHNRLEQRIGTRLSQQQIRYVKMLELNTEELEEAVAHELADNPALEAVTDDEKPPLQLTDDGQEFSETSEDLRRADYANAEEIPHSGFRIDRNRNAGNYDFTPADNSESLYDVLNRQIDVRRLKPDVARMAHYIIGSLDSNGYLRRPLRDITDDLLFGEGIEVDPDVAQEALEAVRSLEPAGIGAFDLRDCLLLQIRALPPSQVSRDALRIIEDCFEEFAMNHLHKIISKLKITDHDARNAIDLIRSLNPKPGSALGSGHGELSQAIIPDFNIDNTDGKLTISLNNNVPELRIEESFSEAVRAMHAHAANKAAKKGKEFITSRYNDARDFIRLIRQRQQTLFSVMTAIAQIQHDYFLSEDSHDLKPMMIKDISALTGLDMSVISRATNNKYVSTPSGIFPLRYFFSDAIGAEGDEFTQREAMEEIKALVDAEDKRHPLSDEKIHKLLEQKGYPMSRRTVAKYRDRAGIPVTRLRKQS